MSQIKLLISIIFVSLTSFAGHAENPFIRETISAGEAGAIKEIVQIATDSVRRDQKLVEDGVARRDAHAKAHGCVRARFEVYRGIDKTLQVGIFSAPKTYDSVVRFSNGNPRVQDDRQGDGRGMAIKIFDDNKEQDFLMINHPVFFVRNTEDYLKFNRAAARGSLVSLAKYFLAGLRLHEAGIIFKIQTHKVASMLKESYFSMTPYKLGERAVKYNARPCFEGAVYSSRKSRNYLHEDLVRRLANDRACFEFGVQVRTNLRTMPLEDSTIEWPQQESPFVPVARVIIPAQKFDSPEQMAACENIAFSPWNAREEHRPLGNMNRIRKAVYDAVSKTRHQLNGVKN